MARYLLLVFGLTTLGFSQAGPQHAPGPRLPFRADSVVHAASHGRLRYNRWGSTRPPRTHTGHRPASSAGQPFIIDSAYTWGPAAQWQYLPSVASNGNEYLVTWVDWRARDAIGGTRVSRTGVVIDSNRILFRLSGSYGWDIPMGLVFDGSHYICVWHEAEDEYVLDTDIYARRLDTTGTPVDTAPIQICTASGRQRAPNVAVGDSTSLIVWADERTDSGQVRACRLSRRGQVLDPDGFVVANGINAEFSIGLGFDGTNWLVAWSYDHHYDESCNVFAARVAQDGRVIDTVPILVASRPGFQHSPRVAFGDSCYLVLYLDSPDEGRPADVYCARVTPGGVVLDSTGIPIDTSRSCEFDCGPHAAFNGTDFLVTWFAESPNPYASTVRSALVNQQGLVRPPGVQELSRVMSVAEGQPYPASLGKEFLVAWGDYVSGGSEEVYALRLDSSGAILPPARELLSQGVTEDDYPAAAFDGTNYLVVWQAVLDTSGSDIYGARVTPEGRLLDPRGFPIARAVRGERPKVIFGGSEYLVVWTDRRSGLDDENIYAARVSTEGRLLDPNGIPVTTAPHSQSWPLVSLGDSTYFICWTDSREWPMLSSAYGARLTHSGVVLDPNGIRISPPVGAYAADMAYGRGCFLVVWNDPTFPDQNIFAARVSQSGVLLDPEPIPVCLTPDMQYMPTVEFDGENFLVAWSDYRNGNADLYGARISPDGVVLDTAGLAIAAGPGNQYWAHLSAGRDCCVLVWQDTRNQPWPYDWFCTRIDRSGRILDPDGLLLGHDVSFGGARVVPDSGGWLVTWVGPGEDQYDIFGIRVTESGEVGEQVILAGGPGWQVLQELAAGNSGQVLLTYIAWTQELNGVPAATYRVWGRIISPDSGQTRGWRERASVPDRPAGKSVKDGGWLAYDQGSRLVYAAKGNKTSDFYCYNLNSNSWQQLALIPDGREGKKPGKGAVGCADGNGVVYATKGNNSQGFYKYVTSKDSWFQLADIPLGISNKKVRGGTDMAYVDGDPDHVYLLKGHRNEFW
ncbi:MAG: hypothetical protein ABIK86_00860, partial [candidate division WOR-3 bacterium]